MPRNETVMNGKFTIYPFGKWWIAKDTETKRAVTKGTSRDDLMEKLLLKTGESK
jgi:hypothetical protein